MDARQSRLSAIRVLIGLVASIALVAALAGPASAAGRSGPGGLWVGPDPDGSTVYVAVSPNHSFGIVYDDGATICLNTVGEFSPAIVFGPGSFDGSTFSFTGDIVCLPSSGPVVVLEDITSSYAFDQGATGSPRDDSLTELTAGCSMRRLWFGTAPATCP